MTAVTKIPLSETARIAAELSAVRRTIEACRQMLLNTTNYDLWRSKLRQAELDEAVLIAQL